MSACAQDIADFALRSVGIGQFKLPAGDMTLCRQVVLIGSGMIWNLYFGALSLAIGFCLATGLALAKAGGNKWLRVPAEAFIFVFRGSPLFIQFFVAYQAFVLLPREGIEIFGATLPTAWLSRAWAGALIVLRPGVRARFRGDLETMAFSARVIERMAPGARRLRPVDVVATLARERR